MSKVLNQKDSSPSKVLPELRLRFKRVRTSTIINTLQKFPEGCWTKGKYQDPEGHYCIVGWLRHNGYALASYETEHYGDLRYRLICLNDDAPTQASAIRQAIEFLRWTGLKTLKVADYAEIVYPDSVEIVNP